jgi:RNase P protein component
MQDGRAITSKAEIVRRTNTARGRKQFFEWDVKEQKAVIKACGISVSKHGNNKPKRNRILQRLSNTDLPTDPGAVWS